MTFSRLNDPIRKPLQVGIHTDIEAAAPDLGSVQIRRALRFYCSGIAYRRACTEGAIRIALDGSQAGAVSASEAADALAKLPQHHTKPPAIPKPKLSLADLKSAAAKRKGLSNG